MWTTDEGLAGVCVHVANDGPAPLKGALRVALYRDAEILVERAEADVELAPHGSIDRDVEEMLGRFVDASGAYGFGSPTHDLVVATLYDELGVRRSQHLRFLHNRPWEARRNEQIGLTAEPASRTRDGVELNLRSRAAAIGVRVRMAGFEPSDDVFDIAPDDEVAIALRCQEPGSTAASAAITADNLAGVVTVDFRAAERANP